MVIEIDGIRWSVVPQYRRCGKPSCRVCRDGPGHGPYYYGTAMVDGRKRSRYIGRTLPKGTQAAQNGPEEVEKLREKVEALQAEIEALRAENEALRRRLEPPEPAKPTASEEATEPSAWKKSRIEDLQLVLTRAKGSEKVRIKVWKSGDFWFSKEPREIAVEWKRNQWHLLLDGKVRKVMGIEKSLQWGRKPYAIRFRVRTDDGEWVVSFAAKFKKDLHPEAKRLRLL